MERITRLASGSLGQESQVLARNTNPTGYGPKILRAPGNGFSFNQKKFLAINKQKAIRKTILDSTNNSLIP
jgi:hypothetical protein